MKIFPLFAALLMATSAGFQAPAATDSFKQTIRIHVSPDGNDSASGDEAHPLASIGAAIRMVRYQRNAAAVSGQTESRRDTIFLHDGTYGIVRPICLGQEDSGLCFKGTGEGKSTISGGVELPAFKDNGDGTWTIDMRTGFPLGADIDQLFVNGRRAVLARTPNLAEKGADGKLVPTHVETGTNKKGPVSTIDCFLTDKVIEMPVDSNAVSADRGPGICTYELLLNDSVSGMLKGIGHYPKQLKVSIFHAWCQTSRSVCGMTKDRKGLYFYGPKTAFWTKLDYTSQFILQDDIAFLDVPGEWFYDRDSGILHYIPRPGEDIATAKATVPCTEGILTVAGNRDSYANDICFKDLTLAYSGSCYGPMGLDPGQASAVSSAAVSVNFAKGFRMERCEIGHTGNAAIWLEDGCQGCAIEGCNIHDIGAGGVKIGRYHDPSGADNDPCLTSGNTVDNCLITEGGRMDASGVGVTIFYASDNSITHNEISDFYYTGISIGWTWGYGTNPSKRNDISYNLIYDIGQGRLSDMGGIYTLGPSEGTKVTHNVIHDVSAFSYGGWGLYNDEGSSDILLENNLVYNCKCAGYHENYGKDNMVRNNVFVNSKLEQLALTRVEDHDSFIFENNVVCHSTGTLLALRWDIANFKASRNLYWCSTGPVLFVDRTLKQWQDATGKDKGSIIADPCIQNWMPTNSKALRKIGFKMFDPSEAGRRK